MDDKYIFSTLTADQIYTQWHGSGDMSTKLASVSISGGANVANKVLQTPLGAMTRVTGEAHELLMQNDSFCKHLRKGFVRVEDAPYEIRDVVADMTSRDGSSPITEKDLSGSSVTPKPGTASIAPLTGADAPAVGVNQISGNPEGTEGDASLSDSDPQQSVEGPSRTEDTSEKGSEDDGSGESGEDTQGDHEDETEKVDQPPAKTTPAKPRKRTRRTNKPKES